VVIPGVWPVLLVPLGQAYVAFCARFVSDTPFRHHYPPLLVAFIALIVSVLLTGLLWALVRQVVGQRTINRTLGARAREPDADVGALLAHLDVRGRVIITTDNTVFAFCSGLIQPRIFLSDGLVGMLSRDELEAVLLHERHHLLQRAPLRLFVTSLARRLAFLFPVLEVVADRIVIRAELEADRASLSIVSVDVLASALVKVMRAGPDSRYQAVLAGFSPTDARVNALLGRPVAVQTRRRDLIVSLAVTGVFLMLATWLATQSLPSPPQCFTCPAFQ